MNGINVGRWILGGVVAGVITWVLEGVASVLYMDQMSASLAAHNLSMEMSAGVVVSSVVVSLVGGLILVFVYALARARFGPGPRSAVTAALVMWIGGYLLTLMGYSMMGLFPTTLLVTWGLVGLVEMILSALVGGWIYREA